MAVEVAMALESAVVKVAELRLQNIFKIEKEKYTKE